MTKIGIGTTLAALAFVGFAMMSGAAEAQSSAYAQGASEHPAACSEGCRKDYDTCIAQMGTAEMCGVDHKLCTKQCQPN